jgi:hypothetical protein
MIYDNKLTLKWSQLSPPLFTYTFNLGSNLLITDGDNLFINVMLTEEGENNLEYQRLTEITKYNSHKFPSPNINIGNINLFQIISEIDNVLLPEDTQNDTITSIIRADNNGISILGDYSIKHESRINTFKFKYGIEIPDIIDPKKRKFVLIEYSNYLHSIYSNITSNTIVGFNKLRTPIKSTRTSINDVKKLNTFLHSISHNFLVYLDYYSENCDIIDDKIKTINSLIAKISRHYSETHNTAEVKLFSISCKGVTLVLKTNSKGRLRSGAKKGVYLELNTPMCQTVRFNGNVHQFAITHFIMGQKINELILKLEESLLGVL